MVNMEQKANNWKTWHLTYCLRQYVFMLRHITVTSFHGNNEHLSLKWKVIWLNVKTFYYPYFTTKAYYSSSITVSQKEFHYFTACQLWYACFVLLYHIFWHLFWQPLGTYHRSTQEKRKTPLTHRSPAAKFRASLSSFFCSMSAEDAHLSKILWQSGDTVYRVHICLCVCGEGALRSVTSPPYNMRLHIMTLPVPHSLMCRRQLHHTHRRTACDAHKPLRRDSVLC